MNHVNKKNHPNEEFVLYHVWFGADWSSVTRNIKLIKRSPKTTLLGHKSISVVIFQFAAVPLVSCLV